MQCLPWMLRLLNIKVWLAECRAISNHIITGTNNSATASYMAIIASTQFKTKQPHCKLSSQLTRVRKQSWVHFEKHLIEQNPKIPQCY